MMRQAWRRTAPFFWAAAAVFVLGLIFGVLLPRFSESVNKVALATVFDRFAPLIERFNRISLTGRILMIFWQNFRAGLIICLSGLVFVAPAMILFGNGFVVGLVDANQYLKGTLTLSQSIMGLLPHGIFELPAFFLLGAVGIRCSWSLWRRLLGSGSSEALEETAVEGGKLAVIAAGLLIVAALMEVLVTPLFLPAIG